MNKNVLDISTFLPNELFGRPPFSRVESGSILSQAGSATPDSRNYETVVVKFYERLSCLANVSLVSWYEYQGCGSGSGFFSEVGSRSGFPTLVRSGLKIKVLTALKTELFFQYLLTIVIVQVTIIFLCEKVNG